MASADAVFLALGDPIAPAPARLLARAGSERHRLARELP